MQYSIHSRSQLPPNMLQQISEVSMSRQALIFKDNACPWSLTYAVPLPVRSSSVRQKIVKQAINQEQKVTTWVKYPWWLNILYTQQSQLSARVRVSLYLLSLSILLIQCHGLRYTTLIAQPLTRIILFFTVVAGLLRFSQLHVPVWTLRWWPMS